MLINPDFQGLLYINTFQHIKKSKNPKTVPKPAAILPSIPHICTKLNPIFAKACPFKAWHSPSLQLGLPAKAGIGFSQHLSEISLKKLIGFKIFLNLKDGQLTAWKVQEKFTKSAKC